MKRFFRKKFLLVVLILTAIGLYIGVIFVLNIFFQMTLDFEGLASILIFAAGCAGVWFFWQERIESVALKAVIIVVFGVIGILFDGAGNFIYNKPLEAAYCAPETELTREVSSYETEEGTMYTHHFACFSESRKETVRRIPTYVSTALRFAEYALLGGIFLGIVRISSMFAKEKN